MKLNGMNYLFIHTINIATRLASVYTMMKIFIVQMNIILIELLIYVTPSIKGPTFSLHNNLMNEVFLLFPFYR